MGVEESIFSWEQCDLHSTAVFHFWKCVLKLPVGQHKIGECIEVITVDYEHELMTFHIPPHDLNDEEYEIGIKVGPKIGGEAALMNKLSI